MSPSNLNPRQVAILRLVAAGHRYGLDIVAHSNGAFRRGTIYIYTAGLEEIGLLRGVVKSTLTRAEMTSATQIPRRQFFLTPKGENLLRVIDKASPPSSATTTSSLWHGTLRFCRKIFPRLRTR